jgi:hypothetical protein
LRKVRTRYEVVQSHEDANVSEGSRRRQKTTPLDDEEEKLAYTKPSDHYHMSEETRDKINIFSWPGDELYNDEACQVPLFFCLISNPYTRSHQNFLPRLLDHLLNRLLGNEYDGDEKEYTLAERSKVLINKNLIYRHKVLRINYTTYDLRRDQDVINPRTSPFIMLLSHEDAPDEEGATTHPYWYARVIGIFHANVTHLGNDTGCAIPQRMDFLWVRWLGRNPDYDAGWQKRRLFQVGYIPGAFGFLDPKVIIRGIHLIPGFSTGRTKDLMGPSIARPVSDKDEDWLYYYVNVYVFYGPSRCY